MCLCDSNVTIWGYENQVFIPHEKLPKLMRQYLESNWKTNWLAIDICVVDEIKTLWNAGIVTTGCCCGHNTKPPYVGVVDNNIRDMKILWYEVQWNPTPSRRDDKDTFYLKTSEWL